MTEGITSQPYSSRTPGILRGIAGDRLGYAFNCEEPRGIKLFDLKLLEALDDLQASSGLAIPDLSQFRLPSDQALFGAGLIKHRGRYSPHRISASPRTFSVWLHTSDECNLGCFYCYIPELAKHRSGTPISGLTQRQASAKDIVDHLLAYCRDHDYEELFVKFAGGEPSLDISGIDSLCHYVEKVRGEVNVKYGMLSNGVFDPTEVLPILDRHQISLSISVDGMAASHDQVRFQRVSNVRMGSWDRVLSSAEALRAAGVRTFFLYTLTRKNLSDLEPFSELVLSYFNGGFRISLERGTQPIPESMQLATSEGLRKLYKKLGQSAPVSARLHRDAKFAEWALEKKKTAACSSCREYVAIGMDGRVASCQMKLRSPVGNLNRESLSTTMDRFAVGEQTKYLADPNLKYGGCTRCEFRHTCAGGCPQHTQNVYSTINRPSPWCRTYGEFFPDYIEANAVHMGRRYRALIAANLRDAVQGAVLPN